MNCDECANFVRKEFLDIDKWQDDSCFTKGCTLDKCYCWHACSKKYDIVAAQAHYTGLYYTITRRMKDE